MQTLAQPTPLSQPALASSVVLALVADSVICADENGRILLLNPAAEKAFGYSESEAIGQQVEMLLPERFRTKHAHQVQDFALAKGAESRLMGLRREVWGRRKNGEEFPAEASVSRQTVDGKILLTVAVRDISERRAMEEQREAIACELDHRVRNILSVVNSLVSLSARSATNIGQFKESLLERLGALARTQSTLQLGAEQSTNLSDLLFAELRQYGTADQTNVVIKGPRISLAPGAAQTLALAFHELATNSAKYGAFSQASGRVAVTYDDDTGTTNGEITIEWREAGGPIVRPPTRQGFGTLLIKQLIEKTFRAKVSLEFLPGGLVCRMTLPRSAVQPAT